jgi:hypothetical protein
MTTTRWVPSRLPYLNASGLAHGHVRWSDDRPPTPFGCRWCGIQRSHHGRQYLNGRGMHSWVRPTDAQIKARMLARRAARTGGA